MSLTKTDLVQIRRAIQEEIDLRVKPIVQEEIEPIENKIAVLEDKMTEFEKRNIRIEQKIDRIWKAIDEDLISAFTLIDKLSKKV